MLSIGRFLSNRSPSPWLTKIDVESTHTKVRSTDDFGGGGMRKELFSELHHVVVVGVRAADTAC